MQHISNLTKHLILSVSSMYKVSASRTQKRMGLDILKINTFQLFTGDSVFIFKTHHGIQVTKTSKRVCAKDNKHVYLFSQCFGNSHSCVQIKSSDYCDGVSAKLKHLNSYDYFFNPVLFIICLEGSHFRSMESIFVSRQNSQASKERGVDMSIVQAALFYTDIL